MASFVGFADAAELGIDQQLVLLIAVDEPNTTSIYGGTLAAPAFKRIMQRALHELGTRKRLRLEPRAHSEARRSGALLRTSYRPSH